MEQYENVREKQIFVADESIEEDIDSTFNKLEQMQDEIITKKISQLEMSLKEIEDVALSIIESSIYANYQECIMYLMVVLEIDLLSYLLVI